MKNKFKYVLAICLMLFLSVSFSNKVYATETSDEFTVLTIKADVSEYDGDIAFTFTQENGFNYNVLLTKAENYTSTIDIVGNIEYVATATLKKDSSKFKVDGLDNKYKVTGKNVEIKFKVIKEEFKVAENTNGDNKTDNKTDTTVINENLDSNAIYKEYIDEVSFIDNNSDYEAFLKIYSNDIMKDYFLKADSLNTADDWNKMSNFEKWNYYILFVRTKTLITGENAVKSEDELLSQLTSEIALLNKINDGEKVIEAVKSIWKWEWKQWEKNGEFINLYDEYTSGSAEKYSETELKDVNEDDNKAAQKEENGLLKGIKNNIISILILVAVGITTIVVIVLRKRKNYDNIDKE